MPSPLPALPLPHVLGTALEHSHDLSRVALADSEAWLAGSRNAERTASQLAMHGIALYPEHGMSRQTMISHADAAMYRAISFAATPSSSSRRGL